MLKLRDGIAELIKKVATSLPPDVEDALRAARRAEAEGSLAGRSLDAVLESITLSRKSARPICQDTGIPVFYVKIPKGLGHAHIRDTILDATRLATSRVPLRPNAVDVITERNSGDNTGDGFPLIYLDESEDGSLVVDLMLKGAGCENLGLTYKLPDSGLNAERDFEGVRRCVLDAVHKAQGKGCPPYILGIGIGGAKDQTSALAKRQLLRKIPDKSPHEAVASIEEKLVSEINSLGIGPLGLGGKTTVLGVKIGVNHRHPASYFVDISFSCWANRRGRLVW